MDPERKRRLDEIGFKFSVKAKAKHVSHCQIKPRGNKNAKTAEVDVLRQAVSYFHR
jgi:hypothetical protein